MSKTFSFTLLFGLLSLLVSIPALAGESRAPKIIHFGTIDFEMNKKGILVESRQTSPTPDSERYRTIVRCRSDFIATTQAALNGGSPLCQQVYVSKKYALQLAAGTAALPSEANPETTAKIDTAVTFIRDVVQYAAGAQVQGAAR